MDKGSKLEMLHNPNEVPDQVSVWVGFCCSSGSWGGGGGSYFPVPWQHTCWCETHSRCLHLLTVNARRRDRAVCRGPEVAHPAPSIQPSLHECGRGPGNEGGKWRMRVHPWAVFMPSLRTHTPPSPSPLPTRPTPHSPCCRFRQSQGRRRPRGTTPSWGRWRSSATPS